MSKEEIVRGITWAVGVLVELGLATALFAFAYWLVR